MPVPTSIDQLSTTAGSNFPAGSDAPSSLDDTQRAHASFIATLRNLVGLVTGTYVPATAIANMGLTPAALGAQASLGFTPYNSTNPSGYINSSGTAANATNAVTAAACSGNSATATKLATASGSAPSYSARAWCVFDGTLAGTNAPIAGGNVASVTRTSAGQYTINFSTAMPDTSYCAAGMPKRLSGQTGGQVVESELTARTTSTFSIVVTNQIGTVNDVLVSVAFFR